MEKYYVFAPIRTYSGAKYNKKAKAVADFATNLLSRKCISFDVKQYFIHVIERECKNLDEMYPSKFKLRVSTTKTMEWGNKEDWYLKVDMIAKDKFPIAIFSILCFAVEEN